VVGVRETSDVAVEEEAVEELIDQQEAAVE